ncbi:MAG: Ku protein [Deltaproteobacteria bacterium]|nr:Ku protein [Deltaproteobacteria bacterium]
MPRSIWTGFISFGLVSVPVRLYGARSPRELRFHLLHDADGARIEQKRVCSADGQEVAYDHVVKGYPIARNRFIVVKPEELAAFDPEASRSIDIQEFVGREEISPIYYENTYYLLPDRGAGKAYALLAAAMKKLGKVAVARVVLRTKQHLCVVWPSDHLLALSTMLYRDEIVRTEELPQVPELDAQPREREAEMAEQLVSALAGKFEPEKFRDEYRDRVLELIDRKARGEEIVVAPRPVERPVMNLLDALAASLAAAKEKRVLPESAAPRAATAVRRKSRTRKSA